MRSSFKNMKWIWDWRQVSRDPKAAVRAVLGVLLALNLAAAWFVFQTPGGSLESLESDVLAAQRTLTARKAALARTERAAELAGQASESGGQFLETFFLGRRTAYSTLLVELEAAASKAGMKARDRSYNYEPVEGSEDLGMLTINANFEGTYADLIEFVNAVDRSKRLLIIDQLAAQPQAQAGSLVVNVKMNAFFREDGSEEGLE
jgi:Tfp pilus assembly protein PilO